MRMLDKGRYKKRFYILSGLSNGLMIGATFMFTIILYQLGLGDAVVMKNMSTSVLSSETLIQSSQAAPWALISLNWFLCRKGVKRWRNFLKSHL